jgi:hypothetical protein
MKPWVEGLVSKEVNSYVAQSNLFGLEKADWVGSRYGKTYTAEEFMRAIDDAIQTHKSNAGAEPPAIPMSRWEVEMYCRP